MGCDCAVEARLRRWRRRRSSRGATPAGGSDGHVQMGARPGASRMRPRLRTAAASTANPDFSSVHVAMVAIALESRAIDGVELEEIVPGLDRNRTAGPCVEEFPRENAAAVHRHPYPISVFALMVAYAHFYLAGTGRRDGDVDVSQILCGVAAAAIGRIGTDSTVCRLVALPVIRITATVGIDTGGHDRAGDRYGR